MKYHENLSTPLLTLLTQGIILLICTPVLLPAQSGCDLCAYYEVRHETRIDGHPSLGSWELIRNRCLNFDDSVIVKVSADGAIASKIELTQKITAPCIYELVDPTVEFVDETYTPVMSPTAEEHGVVTITNMTSTSVEFEYTHPTDQPASDEKYRIVRLALKDYNTMQAQYTTVGYVVIWVHRPPVLMVHGLWGAAGTFSAMHQEFRQGGYYPWMVHSADYEATNASAFATNVNVVPAGIDALISQCRDSEHAAGKANLVVHSMGGVLSRLYLQNAYREDVYRLVTCNTPHVGAQTANWLLDPAWDPLNDTICSILEWRKMPCYDGAVEDLQVGSPANAAMNAGVHPPTVGVHALITMEEPPGPSDFTRRDLNNSDLLAGLIGLVNACGTQILDSIFNSDIHDFVVAGESQSGGLSGLVTTVIPDQIHIGSVGNMAVIDEVQSLLDEPYNSSRYTFGGYQPAPMLTYINTFACTPISFVGQAPQVRSSSGMSFAPPQPSSQTWQSGDTAAISVNAPGIDTIVLIYELDSDLSRIDKAPGPSATFALAIPEGHEGFKRIIAVGYSAAGELSGFVADSMEIVPAYQLTGISVSPTELCIAVGDTSPFVVIGHYDDGIDRVLNGNQDVNYAFTTWSASQTYYGNIFLEESEDDTLFVDFGGFFSDTVKIMHQASALGAVFWLGSDGDWDDGSKWDIGCPPGLGNTVYISSGTCTIPPFVQARARAVNVTSSALINQGTLEITSSTAAAIDINEGTFENQGTLQISNVSTTALQMQGTSPSDSAYFINRSIMRIDTSAGTYGIYIGSGSRFLNDTTGDITLVSCGLFSTIETAFSPQVNFENLGSFMTTDGAEVGGFGRYRNSGYFAIRHSIPDTYAGFQGVYLENTSTGHTDLQNIYNSGIFMPYSGDTLINAGLITIDGASDQGINANYCMNSGSIELYDITNEAVFVEGNNYAFDNTSTGSLGIGNSGIGIYVRNSNAEFHNAGQIDIDTTLAEGILVRSNGKFVNDTTGLLSVRQTGTRGINVLDNINTTVENYGHIEITSTAGNGIHASGNAAFNNHATGTIGLCDITGSAMATSGNSLAGNTIITNAGRIEIRLPVTDWGISHTKRFTNHPCGLIYTEKAISSTSANFINNGFLHLANITAHNITAGGKIVNDGIIEDRHGLIDPIAQTTNNSVIIAPPSYNGCSDTVLGDFATLGSLSGWTASEGYTHPDLGTVGGQFDDIGNTFTPNTMGILHAAWYFQFTDDNEACMDTVTVLPQVSCPVNCTGDPFYWTGCLDADWTSSSNWNLSIVPTALDSVTITGNPAGGIFPEISVPTTLQYLGINPGAQLTLKNGTQLSLQD